MIAAIKERVKIADIVKVHKGRGACPLHNGKNTFSFSIKGDRWKCFSCGEHGDIIDLIKALNGFDTKGAIRFLAERAGLSQGPMSYHERAAMVKAKAERERRAALVAKLDRWTARQRDTLSPLLRGTRRLLAKGISYHAAVTLGAEFFDNMAFLEYTHDDILCRGDRAAHLILYKTEEGF